MPAFRIKSKSNTEYLRLHDLHTCRKSAKTSKSSQTQVKTFQLETELDTFFQTQQNASSNKEVSVCNSTLAGFDGPYTQLLNASPFSLDPVSIRRSDILSETNPSNLETIFSPDLEHRASPLKSANYIDEAKYEGTRLPHLVADGADNATCISSEYQTCGLSEFYISDSIHEGTKLPHLVADETDDTTCVSSEYQTCGLSDFISDCIHEGTKLPHLVADVIDDATCVSSEYQTCSLSDFYISDSISAFPFDNSVEVTDVITAICPINEYMNSDIMIDMGEGYMILPFLERTVETGDDDDSVQETMMNFNEASLYLAVHPENENKCNFGNLEEIECFDQLLVFNRLPDLPQAVSSILLPQKAQERMPVTLVLDLDETLVHSTMEQCDDADFTFPVFFNMKHHTVYVRQRPFLQMFLDSVAQMFEIVIFTAAQSIYAGELLDILDPDRKIISKRIYRESCIFSDGTYTKDLTILGVDLAKVVIIDNTPQVFRLQVNNGIPIESWFGDPLDHALVQLLPFLETLVYVEDVRPIIAKKFSNNE
ncbi:uncharacterized protein LOC103996140 [Musa acuminata AAA Group]|uniref:uncharacterized protein LOC103996140 n=1 Tax=Musa acuminata AAA Group TaxID=214697 RepID=UPI0031DD0FD4